MIQETCEPQLASKSVVLADPHALFREGITKILREAGFQVLGQTDTAYGLDQLVNQLNPDIILLDWEISQGDLDAIQRLTKNARGIIVLLAQPEHSEGLLPALQAGIRGCLSVNLSAQEFVQALSMLARGDIILSREVASSVRDGLSKSQPFRLKSDLSYREREVLCLVGEGATNREIAEKLIVSEHTVKVHLRSILNKLNVRNRQQAAAYAAREGIIASARAGNGPYAA